MTSSQNFIPLSSFKIKLMYQSSKLSSHTTFVRQTECWSDSRMSRQRCGA